MKPSLTLVNLPNRNRSFPLFKPEASLTRVRLRVIIPPHYQQEPVISSLVSQYALSVNISRAALQNDQQPGQLDLELTGTVAQLQAGLAYLASLNWVIHSRPNPDGDGWYC